MSTPSTTPLPNCTAVQKAAWHLLQHHPPLRFIQEPCLDSERGCMSHSISKKQEYTARTVFDGTDAEEHFPLSLWGFWDGLLTSLCPAKLPLPRDSFAGDSAMPHSRHFHACTVPLRGFVHITCGSLCEEGSEAKLLPKNCLSRAISS